MSWIAATLLGLAQPTPAPLPSTRAGVLVSQEQPSAAVVLLSGREAWSPENLEGTAVCSVHQRCAGIAEVRTCEAPGCAFGFGVRYVLDDDVAQLQPLDSIDEAVLVALEREPSLRPLVARVRARLHPQPAEVQWPPPGPPASRPSPDVKTPSPKAEPEHPGWNDTVGWSFEATAVPTAGVFFGANDNTALALGGTVTLGLHHQFQMRPSKGPDTPKGAKRQRLPLVALVGNNLGADLVFRTIVADGRPMFGVAADFAAGAVYNHFGDGRGKQHPTRLRVLSMLDHLIPMPGLHVGPRGTPRLDVRFGGPVSVLLRQRVAVHARLDMGFLKYGGPSEGYILIGVGVLGRKQLGRARQHKRHKPLRAR